MRPVRGHQEKFISAFSVFALLAAPLSAQQAIEYEISFPNAANHVGNVTATFRGIPPGTWGSTIGIALDLTLRQRFNAPLDHYMRMLWREFGRHQSADFAPTRTYTTADLRMALGRLTNDTAFASDFFRRFIEGSEVPDYTPLLAQAGFLLKADSPTPPALGGVLQSDSAGVRVGSRPSGGSLYAAGLDSGDVIREIESLSVTEADSVLAIVDRGRVGDTLRLGVVRR